MVDSALTASVALVDDDPSVRRALARLLRAYGFEVHLFESAEEFLMELGRHAAPDCLILDIHLGGMNGYELLEELQLRGASVPTIMITAMGAAEGDTAARLTSAGIVPCLHKPVSAGVLLDAIHQALHPTNPRRL